MNARTISMPLKRFTLIGATTRSGMLSSPMRDRFKIHEHLDYYAVDDLAEIVTINARKLNTAITPDAALEIANRSRGTPRIANSRLWWARSFSASERDGSIDLATAQAALKMSEVDLLGLDKQDRRYLETIINVFDGGPTGVEALAATMNLPSDTLSDEVEPYLLREQMIVRTPRGRMATRKAYQHIGKPWIAKDSESGQKLLFDE
jgi:Holliday junction DNA helicase RuvB